MELTHRGKHSNIQIKSTSQGDAAQTGRISQGFRPKSQGSLREQEAWPGSCRTGSKPPMIREDRVRNPTANATKGNAMSTEVKEAAVSAAGAGEGSGGRWRPAFQELGESQGTDPSRSVCLSLINSQRTSNL